MSNKTFHLICETQTDLKVINESADASKPRTLKYSGVFMMSEQKNGNGRIYPYEVLKPEVDRFIKEMVETNRAISELEHPSSSEIDPARACARILSLKEDNKCWIGEAVVLCSDKDHGIIGTPCGDILGSLIQFGTEFGVSSRALGEIGDDGIVTDLHLVTCDTVLNPSVGIMVTPDGNRFVNGILESKQWVCNNHGEILECKYNKLEKDLSKLPNTFDSRKRAEYIGAKVKAFLDSIVK